MKKFLVVGAGDYQIPAIKRISEMGFEAYCVDKNASAPGFKFANGYSQIDVLDENACLEFAKKTGIDAVITYGATITLPTVSFIGERLGLPVLPAETAEISKSKYQIKKRLSESGCNIYGEFFQMNSIEDAKAHTFTYPCVIKPCDGSGSKGVSIVNSEEELDSAIKYAYESSRWGNFYAESFIEGSEYTVEAFVCDGNAYIYGIIKTTFEKNLNGELSYGHRLPSGLSPKIEQIISDEVKKAISALKITMMSVNFDVIWSEKDEKAYIIDCGIRVGQNLISSHLIPLSRGVNVLDNTLLLALGEKIDASPKYNKCIATRLLIYKPGVICNIKDLSDLIGKNGIIDVVLRKKVGDVQNEYKDKSDTCGWVIATGETPAEAESNAENAKNELKKYIIIK